MPKESIQKKSNKSNNKWLWIGLASVLIGAPNGTVVKGLFSQIDSITFNFLRCALLAVAFLPAVVLFSIKNKDILRRNAFSLLMSTIGTVTSLIAFYKAMELSTASYASIVSLLTPIFLVFLSNKLIKEKVGPRAVAGITLAAIGGLLVVALPAILHGAAGSVFYPIATVLVLINSIGYPVSTIYQRKSNENGVPFSVYAGITAIGTVIVTFAVSFFQAGPNAIIEQAISLPAWGWIAIIYSGFIVTFVSRTMWIKSYEHMGSAVGGGLSYLETMLGIALPVIILGEILSIELVAGALIILIGVYVAESRPNKNGPKYHYSKHLHYLHHHSHLR